MSVIAGLAIAAGAGLGCFALGALAGLYAHRYSQRRNRK